MMTDKQARAWITDATSLSRNIFLNAGAGSGKTESLVRRVLTLIEHGADMSSIVAITFTKEAARMFYDRIGRELRKAAAAAAEAGQSEKAAKLNAALDDIDQAFFGTIDSFCRKLLIEHPQEAGISSRFLPLEREAEQEAFLAELFTSMQRNRQPRELWEQYNELREFGLGTSDFKAMIRTGWNMASFELVTGTKPDPCELDEQEVKDCTQIVRWFLNFLEPCFVGEGASCSPFSKANEDKFDRVAYTLEMDERTAALRAVVLLKELIDGLPKTKQKKELEALAEKNKDLKLRLERLTQLAVKAGPKMTANANEKYYRCIRFMADFAAYAQRQMEKRGFATFDSCLMAAVKLLREDGARQGMLTRYIQNRYKYFLVDEYQDTSGTQSELFFRLTASQPKANWKEIRPNPGALFIVGDEKQAIYRFRGGDVDNYSEVRRLFEADDDCDVLQLSCNFRSSQPVTDWFNKVFADASFFGKNFPAIEPSEKQRRFNEQSAVLDGVYEYDVILKKKGFRGAPSVEGNEEAQVLKLVKDLQGRRIFTYDHAGQSTSKRPITYSDIMIITANKASLKKYIQLLSKNGIPYSVAGNSRLAENPVLPMMERYLDGAIHFGDKFKTYGCLMHPPFSLTEREIYDHVNGEGGTAAKSFALLEAFRAAAGQERPSALFGRMIRDLESWRWLVPEEGDSMDTLYYALELVRAEEAAGKLRNAEDLLTFMKQELRNGGYEYEMASEERSRGIKLLNLHKAKGLEAPVVILADAAKPREFGVDICRDFGQRKAYVGSVTRYNEFTHSWNEIAGTKQFATQMAAEQEQLRKEQIRLRYVAATRGENVLLIPRCYENTGANNQPTAGGTAEGRWDSFLTASADPIPKYQFTQAIAGTPAWQDTTGDIWKVKELDGEFSEEKSYDTLNPSKVKCRQRPLPAKPANVSLEGRVLSVDDMTEPLIDEEDDLDIYEPVKSDDDQDAANQGTDDGAVLVDVPKRWCSVPATVLGTAVHRLMEAMVDRRHQTVEANHWKSVSKVILKEEGVVGEIAAEAEAILCKVAEAMQNGGYLQEANDIVRVNCPWIPEELPADLLAELRGAKEVCTELPFSLYLPAQSPILQELAKDLQIEPDADGFINGIMDLIYYKDGKWIICDYKTNYESKGLYKHYEGQLLLYRQIAKTLLKLDELPEAYLYHIPCKVE